MTTTRKFNEALLEAVDFAFNSLGKSCQQALYFHLKTTFHIRRAEISRKVEEFDGALRLIFKDGAVFLENLILEKLCERLEVKLEKKDACDFVEAVTKVKCKVLKRESTLMISTHFLLKNKISEARQDIFKRCYPPIWT